MEKTIKEQLEEFLFENNCYSQFITNLLDQHHLTLDEYFESRLKEYRYKKDSIYSWNCIFLDAFTYALTPEGETYWINIYYKWAKYL